MPQHWRSQTPVAIQGSACTPISNKPTIIQNQSRTEIYPLVLLTSKAKRHDTQKTTPVERSDRRPGVWFAAEAIAQLVIPAPRAAVLQRWHCEKRLPISSCWCNGDQSDSAL